jgi:hypothetical protein
LIEVLNAGFFSGPLGIATPGQPVPLSADFTVCFSCQNEAFVLILFGVAAVLVKNSVAYMRNDRRDSLHTAGFIWREQQDYPANRMY